ncbi:MAG: GNAT family N-acetyltransferase [Candidatus Hydrogenedentes bacterium]|nr:GNAT family N-acetyltransferase [Candidatus Hydrogenedentota bacterium]
MDLELRSVNAETTRPLRQRILRPHQRVEDVVFPGDDHPAARHFAVCDGDAVVAVSSLYHESPPDAARQDAWRLRGVATLNEYRGQGLATRILMACIEHIRSSGGGLLWCTARTSAKGFYDKHGFQTVGDPFVLPNIGEHYHMQLEIPPK